MENFSHNGVLHKDALGRAKPLGRNHSHEHVTNGFLRVPEHVGKSPFFPYLRYFQGRGEGACPSMDEGRAVSAAR